MTFGFCSLLTVMIQEQTQKRLRHNNDRKSQKRQKNWKSTRGVAPTKMDDLGGPPVFLETSMRVVWGLRNHPLRAHKVARPSIWSSTTHCRARKPWKSDETCAMKTMKPLEKVVFLCCCEFFSVENHSLRVLY